MRQLFTLVALTVSIWALGQTTNMNIYKTNGTVLQIPISSIDSITYTIQQISTTTGNNTLTGTYFVGQVITSDTLYSGRSYKGTLQAGKTYYFNGPITINAGDTLLLQSGVKLLAIDPTAEIDVYGAFISLGTEQNPNWITGAIEYANPATYKLNTPTPVNLDPALNLSVNKAWSGIQCDTSCHLLVIKWTHIEFVGNIVTSRQAGLFEGAYAVGDNLFTMLFQNYNGICILEDNWIYGTATDAIRVNGGKIAFFRNTVEKMAHDDGEGFNVKGGTVGDMGYNLFIGDAKGSTKAANTGQKVGSPQTFVNFYNNTYVNCGWRTTASDKGSSIDYESGCAGNVYNNITVNCFTGIRVLSNPAANFTEMKIGNNLAYGDTVNVLNQIYPPGKFVFAPSSDIPNPANWYPGYNGGSNILTTSTLGIVYNVSTITGAPTVGANNPQFVNYPLPISPVNGSLDQAFQLGNFVGTYDFHLASGSPAIGTGNTTAFTPYNATSALTNSILKATVTPPNVDLGAYPTDGTGNQHTVSNSH
jgi:hypothetical protein